MLNILGLSSGKTSYDPAILSLAENEEGGIVIDF